MLNNIAYMVKKGFLNFTVLFFLNLFNAHLLSSVNPCLVPHYPCQNLPFRYESHMGKNVTAYVENCSESKGFYCCTLHIVGLK